MSQTATVSSKLSNTASTVGAIQSFAPLAGRLLIAPLFLLSGISKLSAPAATIGMIASSGLPLAPLGFAAAILVEVIGSIALIVGYRTRLVAAVMALFTLATALAFHANLADQNQFFHFFKNISIVGGLLQIVAFGAGRFSLDARTH
ncbi:LysR family transcriptional regulator [Sphingomonas oleivorans]|uniref:LysR family transcriptional regulator n=2 Tax=Sphingomonas oleivorans TaxID=1735121 RepID=A0A2T5FUE0_9SPHN|nr:DoxX family protein [Sphingomonas oleivorans]PTQ07893.1 LysR family transcriptional regulator [Sphingomonas oleivorans]